MICAECCNHVEISNIDPHIVTLPSKWSPHIRRTYPSMRWLQRTVWAVHSPRTQCLVFCSTTLDCINVLVIDCTVTLELLSDSKFFYGIIYLTNVRISELTCIDGLIKSLHNSILWSQSRLMDNQVRIYTYAICVK